MAVSMPSGQRGAAHTSASVAPNFRRERGGGALGGSSSPPVYRQVEQSTSLIVSKVHLLHKTFICPILRYTVKMPESLMGSFPVFAEIPSKTKGKFNP